jgi:hypothetical protein
VATLRGRCWSISSALLARTENPMAAARASSSRIKNVLPMPASPSITVPRLAPAATSPSRLSRDCSSATRPVNEAPGSGRRLAVRCVIRCRRPFARSGEGYAGALRVSLAAARDALSGGFDFGVDKEMVAKLLVDAGVRRPRSMIEDERTEPRAALRRRMVVCPDRRAPGSRSWDAVADVEEGGDDAQAAFESSVSWSLSRSRATSSKDLTSGSNSAPGPSAQWCR